MHTRNPDADFLTPPIPGNLSLGYSDRAQDIIQRPARPARNNLRPYFLRNGILGIQQAPVRTGLGLDPLEVFDLTPAVLVIWAVVVQGL